MPESDFTLPRPESDFTLPQDVLPVTSVHTNTNQVVIKITEDKLQNILGEYTRGLENQKPWLTILMLMLALLGLTLADLPPPYKSLITKETWQSICGGATFAVGIWFINAVYKSCQAWRNRMTVENVIEQIKTPPPRTA